MRKYEVLLGVALTVALVDSVGPVAHAQWGDPISNHCSSSTGCYMKNGKAVQARLGPKLTAREESLRQQCNLRLAGTAFAGAGGIMSGNWLAIIGAAFNGGSALTGPCKQLWDSTKRYRR